LAHRTLSIAVVLFIFSESISTLATLVSKAFNFENITFNNLLSVKVYKPLILFSKAASLSLSDAVKFPNVKFTVA
jgi:hypothetical protein